jgi:hypothetical protein
MPHRSARLSLFLPGQLRERLIVLDDLDAGFGGFDSEDSTRCTDSRLHQRAKALRPFWFLMFADPRFRLFNSIRESRSVKNPFAVSILPSIIAPRRFAEDTRSFFCSVGQRARAGLHLFRPRERLTPELEDH